MIGVSIFERRWNFAHSFRDMPMGRFIAGNKLLNKLEFGAAMKAMDFEGDGDVTFEKLAGTEKQYVECDHCRQTCNIGDSLRHCHVCNWSLCRVCYCMLPQNMRAPEVLAKPE